MQRPLVTSALAALVLPVLAHATPYEPPSDAWYQVALGDTVLCSTGVPCDLDLTRVHRLLRFDDDGVTETRIGGDTAPAAAGACPEGWAETLTNLREAPIDETRGAFGIANDAADQCTVGRQYPDDGVFQTELRIALDASPASGALMAFGGFAEGALVWEHQAGAVQFRQRLVLSAAQARACARLVGCDALD